jgi:hypothetical protein
MQVPRLVPQEKKQGLPSVSAPSVPSFPQMRSIGPEAYGSSVGAAMERAGAQLTAHAERMQKEKDAMRGLQLVVQAQQRVTESLYGENGLLSSQGLEADGAYKKFQETYVDIMSEFSDLAENGNQQAIVMETLMRQMPGYQGQVARHEAAELQKAKVESLKASLSQLSEMAVQSSGDPETLEVVSNEVERIATALSGHLGEEVVVGIVDETMSDIHTKIVNKLLVGDPEVAQAYFDTHKDEIDSVARTKIEAFIADKREIVENQALSEEIYTNFGLNNEDDALEYIRKHYEGEKEDKIISRVQALYVDARRIQTQKEQQTYDALYSLVGRASSFSEALDEIERSGLKEQHKRTLRNYAKERFGISTGRTPKTDPETLARLQEMKNNYTLFEKYPTWESFFAEFGDSLSYSDQDRYRNMYEDIRNGRTSTMVYKTQEVLDAKIKEAGIKDPVIISQIHQRANQYLRDASAKKNGALTPVEEATIIDSLFDEITLKKKTGMFDIDILAKDETGQRWQIPPGYVYSETLGQPILCISEEGLCYDVDGKPVARMVFDESEEE